jgi:hypothetical protein
VTHPPPSIKRLLALLWQEASSCSGIPGTVHGRIWMMFDGPLRRIGTGPDPGRHCLVLTQWTAHLERLTAALQETGHDPVVLRGGMGTKARAAASGYTSLGFPDPRRIPHTPSSRNPGNH